MHVSSHLPGQDPAGVAEIPFGSAAAAVQTPLLKAKDYAAPSIFQPENLLREARRQKRLPAGDVPEICALDPDGDLVRQLCADGRAQRSP